MEDKPLALRRHNELVFTKGYELIEIKCGGIPFSGQISFYLIADARSVSLLPGTKLKTLKLYKWPPLQLRDSCQGLFAVA